MADCCLLLSGRKQGLTVLAFSTFEWLWGAMCVYLLFKQQDEFPAWLAIVFVVQLLAWLLYVISQALRGRLRDNSELSRSEAWAGGIFGAVYALVSAAAWLASGP